MSMPSYDPHAEIDEEIVHHPATEAILRYFEFGHLPAGPLRETSRALCHTAYWMAAFLPEGPELTVGLRKLLEAKDAFVRQALDLTDPEEGQP